MFRSNQTFTGSLSTKIIKCPRAPLAWRIKNAIKPAFWLGYLSTLAARSFSALTGMPVLCGSLSAKHIKANGEIVDYGTVSYHLVTTAFVVFMVDELQAETSEWGDFKFHASGTGTTAANVTDTAMETDSGVARNSGTQTEGASANIYRSVGTQAYVSSLAITEHGLFSIVAAGTLMDRHVFAALNVVSGDSIQFTYELTCTAGG